MLNSLTLSIRIRVPWANEIVWAMLTSIQMVCNHYRPVVYQSYAPMPVRGNIMRKVFIQATRTIWWELNVVHCQHWHPDLVQAKHMPWAMPHPTKLKAIIFCKQIRRSHSVNMRRKTLSPSAFSREGKYCRNRSEKWLQQQRCIVIIVNGTNENNKFSK